MLLIASASSAVKCSPNLWVFAVGREFFVHENVDEGQPVCAPPRA
jgi:hypothetical protein